MAYRIALNFEDGATRIFECNSGETVLDAAYRNKINLPMDCSNGVCGTCKCRCEHGSYDMGDDYIEDALTQGEAQAGLVLTCQMIPSGDCVIAVPVPSSACKLKPAVHGAQVVSVTRVADGTFILGLRLDVAASCLFLPGQYVHLEVPGAVLPRAYSFSSKPGATVVSFLIRNLPGGLMSEWLANTAGPGARMQLTGPYGSFFLRPIDRPVVMLAGGTGLAPMLSMLETMADGGTAQKIHLIYGVNRDDDLVETARLDTLATRLLNFSWAACVADPQSGCSRKGYVTQHLSDAHLNAGNCAIYVCGPPAMVEAVRGFLDAKGINPAQFHYEKFAAADAPA